MNFHEWILIGVLFQFFDFNFGVVDIIPDFIGFMMIAYAFWRAKVRYATLGIGCAALLTISSFVEMLQPQLLAQSATLWLQIVAIIVGLITILQFACIFSASKEILQGEDSLFPILFISAQIFVQLFTSIGMHLSFDILEGFTVFATVFLLFLYIYFLVFLWKRKNKERALWAEANEVAEEIR